MPLPNWKRSWKGYHVTSERPTKKTKTRVSKSPCTYVQAIVLKYQWWLTSHTTGSSMLKGDVAVVGLPAPFYLQFFFFCRNDSRLMNYRIKDENQTHLFKVTVQYVERQQQNGCLEMHFVIRKLVVGSWLGNLGTLSLPTSVRRN